MENEKKKQNETKKLENRMTGRIEWQNEGMREKNETRKIAKWKTEKEWNKKTATRKKNKMTGREEWQNEKEEWGNDNWKNNRKRKGKCKKR